MSGKMTRKMQSVVAGFCSLVFAFGCLAVNVHAEDSGVAAGQKESGTTVESKDAGNYACGSYTLLEGITEDQNRPYLDYFKEVQTGETGNNGILRRNTMMVYLMPGETVYLGSSVYNSQFDINGNVTSAETGCDIVVIAPDGTRTSLDVIQNGAGYIANPAKEAAGPTIQGIHQGGYEAISYEAEREGIYQILYQSVNGDGENPGAKKKSDKSWEQKNSTVAAWNATVIGTDGTYKSGRLFTKMLAINMGAQDAVFASPFYVQTTDGFIYWTKLQDALPWGFIFYANNRGIVDIETDYNLYQSYRYGDSTLRAIGVDTHNPNTPDTKENYTYNIFLEEPSEELVGKVYPRAYAPSKATNFHFIGTEAEDKTHTGCGGYFTFDTTNASSATVTIDMTGLVYEDGTNGGIVKISNVIASGNNKFYWDGLDAHGNIVPTGEYTPDQMKVSVTTYAGDYHFPMLDVEAMPNGLTIERVNWIYQEVKEDGNVVVKDVTAQYEEDKYKIYYNNPSAQEGSTQIADGVDASNGVDSKNGALRYGTSSNTSYGDKTAINVWTYAAGDDTTVCLNHPIAVVTESNHTNLTGRVFFDNNKDGLYDHANQDFVISGILVTLTYYEQEGDTWVEKTMSTTTDAAGRYYFFGIPVDQHEKHPATIRVADNTGYQVTSGEKITNSKISFVTPEGKKSTVDADDRYRTKGTAEQTMTLGMETRYIPELRYSDVGITYSTRKNPMTVWKSWTEELSNDSNQPEAVTVYAEEYYEKDGQPVVLRELSYQLNKSNYWIYTDNTIPETVVASDGLTYDVKVRFVKEEYTTRDGHSYTYEFKEDGDYSGQVNPYATFMRPMEVHGIYHVYTVENALKNKTLKVKKVDAADDSKVLSGAEMTLWNLTVFTELPDGVTEANKVGKIDTGVVYQSGNLEYLVNEGKIYIKSATATTGDDGMATFPNSLPANSYIITESVAPEGYYLSEELYSVTLQSGDTEKTVKVTNEKMPEAQFDLDGGTGKADAISAASGTKITLPTAPTKEHYQFKGWKTGETTYDAGAEYELTADVTFTAQWEQVSTDPEEITQKVAFYRVEYYKENLDGTYSLVADDTQMLMGEIGTEVTAPAEKTYENYTERTEPNEATGKVVMPVAGEDGTPVILVLKRYYDLNEHTVSFDLDGGTGDAEDRTEKYGTTIQLPAAPTKNHFEFKGWKVGETTYPAGADYEVTDDVTLVAQWEQVSTDPEVVTPKVAVYRVEYYKQNLDGTYTLVPEDTELLTDEIGKEVTAPEKTYENYTERTEPNEATGKVVMPVAGDDGTPVILVLKRYYDLKEHTVSFDLDGGTGDAEERTEKYGSTITLPEAPVKEGYTFEGWRFGDTTYPAGAEYEVTGDATLVGQWKLISVEVETSNGSHSGAGTNISGGSKPSGTEAPDTGDSRAMMPWMGILGLCSVILIRMSARVRKER